MSVTNDQTAEYATTADVAEFFKKFDDFDDTTTPSGAEVKKRIRAWSAKFDRKTGHSWRENQVHDETHEHDRIYYWMSGHPVKLLKNHIITPLDPQKGDKLEVWTGNDWDDWVADDTMTEGRDDGDYWVDSSIGILWVYDRAILRPNPKFRVTYRYGRDPVPADIRDAVAKAAAADLIDSDLFGETVPGNETAGNIDPQRAADKWERNFDATVSDYKKFHFI